MNNRQRSISPKRQLARIRRKLRVPSTEPEKLAQPIHPSQPYGMRTIRLAPLSFEQSRM